MSVWITASSSRNPYMSLLTEHLRGRGLDVEGGVEPQGNIAKRALREGFPEVLHVHWLNIFFLRDDWPPAAPLLAAGRIGATLSLFRAARSAGTRIVWTAHNLGNHENRLQWADSYFHRELADLADGIIAHSECAKSTVATELDLDERHKIEVIPHGHYLDVYSNDVSRSKARAELGLTEDERVFLFVGLIRPYKNVPRLIETFSEDFSGRNARLVVAGSAQDEALEGEVRRCAAGDDQIDLYLEYIDDADLQYFLNASDAVVLPYRDILTSGSAVLAMSFGRPVVAPQIGTIRDLVEPEGGFLYDPEGGEGLSGAMRRMLEASDDELTEIGRRNLERARSWSWSEVARRTHELYVNAREGAYSP